MKVAVLVEFFPPKLGSDRRIFEIMKRLSKKNEIHFIVIPSFRMLSGKLHSTKETFNKHSRKTENTRIHDGIVGHFIMAPLFLMKLWKASYMIAYFLTLIFLFPKVARSLKKISPHVIVLNYPSVYTGVLGYLLGKILKRSVIVDFSDLIAQYTIILLNISNSCLKAKLLIYIQDQIVKKADRIVVVSNYIKEYALRLRVKDKKVFVVPNGVDIKFFDPNKFDMQQIKSELNLRSKYICLYFGRPDKWAGVDLLMKLPKMFERKMPDVQFVLLGAESSSKKSRNLTILKEVPYDSVPMFLAAANVVLVPFPFNDVSNAASPLKLFEAMSMKKCIIASKVKGIEEIITSGQNGILAGPHDVNQWYDVISHILNSKNLAARLSANARLTVEKRYSWNLLAKKYDAILQQSNC